MTDETPTPPAGTVSVKRAAARQRPLHAVPSATPAGRAPGYRVVLADDEQSWSEDGSSGLLDLAPDERLAGFERLTDGDAALVVLCGARQSRAVARDAAVARGTLEARIAVVRLPGGPLARFAMARIAERALGGGRRAGGVVVSALPELAGDIVDVGLVGSVTSLDVPGVKLGHHLTSYLPGAKLFAVQVTPSPFVARVGSTGLGADAEGFAEPGFGPAGARMLVAGARPVPADLATHWGVEAPTAPVPVSLPLADFWRDGEAGEVVVVPADPAAWVESRIPAGAAQPCRWCGEMRAESVKSCVFCGHTPA